MRPRDAAAAQFLGAVGDGRLAYSHPDAVELTGHSCHTVAAGH